jgi:ABC-type phosphate transport system auxiliary subunit
MKTLIIIAALISGAAYGQPVEGIELEIEVQKLQSTIQEMQTAICDKLDQQMEIMKAQLIYLKLQQKINYQDPTESLNRAADQYVGVYDLQQACQLGHMSNMHGEY